MTFTTPIRLVIFSLAGGSTLACSEASGALPGAGGSSAGTPNGGSSAGLTSTAGAAGSTAQVGGGMGGNPVAGSGNLAGDGGIGGGGMGGGGGLAGNGGTINASGGAPTGPASGRFTARPTGSMPGTNAGYWEYLPPHYGNGDLYPLILFHHGLGENGNGAGDLDDVLVHGPPKLIEADQWPETRRFIVLSPQQANGCPTAQQVDSFLTFALGEYDVDPKRIYLTGLSCGGNATWDYLADHTDERVAAAVPICGLGVAAFGRAGCAMGKVPIWAFVGDADSDNNVRGSTETVASLEACTNPAAVDVKLTVYPGVGHESWPPVYAVTDPAVDIYAWMLSHPKP